MEIEIRIEEDAVAGICEYRSEIYRTKAPDICLMIFKRLAKYYVEHV